jgi:hypothetical protein
MRVIIGQDLRPDIRPVVRSGGYLVFKVEGRVWGDGARKYPSVI